MAKSLSKKFKQPPLTYILVIIMLLIISTVISLVIIYLPTVNWLTYKSNNVPLIFKYPQDWPISKCSEPILFPQMKIEEMISFKDECDWGQYANSMGNITIEKLDENTDPRRTSNSPFMDEDNRTLEPIKIGNMNGYSLVVKPTSKIPYSKEKVYYVVANNLVYKIRLLENAFYKGSKEETVKTFERMLETFKF